MCCGWTAPPPHRVDPADDLVTGDDRYPGLRQFTIDDAQVGAAHAASQQLFPGPAGSGLPAGKAGPFEEFSDFLQHHRLQHGPWTPPSIQAVLAAQP